MAISSAAIARDLLTLLGSAGVTFVVLHGEERLQSEATFSDVDVAVDRPPLEMLRAVLSSARYTDPGIHLVMHWEYDAYSYSTYWLDSDGRNGVQLDLVWDPRGRAKYGIRTDVAIAEAGPGVQFPVLRDDHEILYLTSKRWYKGDAVSLASLAPRLPAALSSGRLLLSSRGNWQVIQASKAIPRRARPRTLETFLSAASPRGIRRGLRPIGVVATAPASPDVLEIVSKRLDRILEDCSVITEQTRTQPFTSFVDRRRPTLRIQGFPKLRADVRVSLTIDERCDADMTSARLVESLVELERRRLGVRP